MPLDLFKTCFLLEMDLFNRDICKHVKTPKTTHLLEKYHIRREVCVAIILKWFEKKKLNSMFMKCNEIGSPGFDASSIKNIVIFRASTQRIILTNWKLEMLCRKFTSNTFWEFHRTGIPMRSPKLETVNFIHSIFFFIYTFQSSTYDVQFIFRFRSQLHLYLKFSFVVLLNDKCSTENAKQNNDTNFWRRSMQSLNVCLFWFVCIHWNVNDTVWMVAKQYDHLVKRVNIRFTAVSWT